MNDQFRNCTNCRHVQPKSAEVCGICGKSFSKEYSTVSSQGNKTAKIVRVIVLTIFAVLGSAGLLYVAYLLGIKSSEKAQIGTVINANTESSPTIFTNTNMKPSNLANISSANFNASVNANTTIPVNKPAKVESSSTPAAQPLKKRSLAEASEIGWDYITQTNDIPTGYYYFYKPDSVKESVKGETVEVWVKLAPMYPASFGKDKKIQKPVSSVVEKIILYCNEDRLWSGAATYYEANGAVLKNISFGNYQLIAPDTMPQALQRTLCKNQLNT